MKHITMILAGVCFFALSAMGQIKKQTTEQDANRSTTLVIKDSKDIDDIELLNDSFNLDDYGVNDVIIIATDEGNQSSELPATEQLAERKAAVKIKPAKIRKAGKKLSKKTAIAKVSKRNKKMKRKAAIAYNSPSKKGKKAKWDKRCYSW